TLSVLMMGGGSLLIAVTPGHAAIGLASPALLLAARLLQGLSIGGEYGASATYLSEMATRDRRGFYSSFQYVTLIAGQLVALGVQLVLQATMSEAALETWGWRIPFLIGAVLAVSVFLIRRGLAETEDFTTRATDKKSSAMALFKEHPGTAFLVVLLTAGGTLAFYAYTTYMQKYLVNSAGYDRQTAARIMTVALAIYMVMQPVIGGLSDRIGRKPLLIAFGIGATLFTVPLFTLIGQGGSPILAFLLVLVGLLIVSGYTAINAIVKAEMFPPHIRALGVALPYAIANALFGGSAEYVALALKGAGREPIFFWYVSGMAALSLLAYLAMRETKRHGTMSEGA
ncbi:MAG: MFS transporter, partial [Sphingobium sp.]